jgi:hypothetical protein
MLLPTITITSRQKCLATSSQVDFRAPPVSWSCSALAALSLWCLIITAMIEVDSAGFVCYTWLVTYGYTVKGRPI